MHVDEFVRGKGRFLVTEYIPTREKVNAKFPLILTTGRILSQYNVGAQTRRTDNNMRHDEDRLEIHPHDAEERGIAKVALDGISNHINKFWTRRMRQRLLDYVAQGDKELEELPLAALKQVVVAPAGQPAAPAGIAK
jgi:NADH-dependent formate dehydrogenase delta subunit FdsD/molydopterin dinucleotide binding protein